MNYPAVFLPMRRRGLLFQAVAILLFLTLAAMAMITGLDQQAESYFVLFVLIAFPLVMPLLVSAIQVHVDDVLGTPDVMDGGRYELRDRIDLLADVDGHGRLPESEDDLEDARVDALVRRAGERHLRAHPRLDPHELERERAAGEAPHDALRLGAGAHERHRLLVDVHAHREGPQVASAPFAGAAACRNARGGEPGEPPRKDVYNTEIGAHDDHTTEHHHGRSAVPAAQA